MSLQPLEKFVESRGDPTWKGKEEYLLYSSETERFRVVVERTTPQTISDSFIGVWRSEELAKLGVNADCEDAKEFAQKLLSTMFYHLSPHQTQHVINALQKDLDTWQEERTGHYANNPSLFGLTPPEPLSISCPD